MTSTHRIALAGSDIAFEWPGESTLLAAALGQGLPLPYECASGGCGTCKARLVEGDVTSLWPEATGLTERDRQRGDRILLCQAVPRTDCVIRAAPDVDVDEPPVRRLPAGIDRLKELNPITRLVWLDLGGIDLPYLPGQFVVVEFPDRARRAYSMSRPHDGDRGIEVVVRAKPGGVGTRWLFEELRIGDRVIVEGPYGKAYHRTDGDRPIVCIGGGSGLGPVLTIADHALGRPPGHPVTLYFGCRHPDELFFEDRLADLAGRGATVHVVVEEEAHPPRRSGLISDAVDADWDDLTGIDVYLAGPTGMVDACLATLVRTGKASADRVFFDRFE